MTDLQAMREELERNYHEIDTWLSFDKSTPEDHSVLRSKQFSAKAQITLALIAVDKRIEEVEGKAKPLPTTFYPDERPDPNIVYGPLEARRQKLELNLTQVSEDQLRKNVKLAFPNLTFDEWLAGLGSQPSASEPEKDIDPDEITRVCGKPPCKSCGHPVLLSKGGGHPYCEKCLTVHLYRIEPEKAEAPAELARHKLLREAMDPSKPYKDLSCKGCVYPNNLYAHTCEAFKEKVADFLNQAQCDKIIIDTFEATFVCTHCGCKNFCLSAKLRAVICHKCRRIHPPEGEPVKPEHEESDIIYPIGGPVPMMTGDDDD